MWSLPIDYDELYKVTNWFYTYALITHPPKKKKKKKKIRFPPNHHEIRRFTDVLKGYWKRTLAENLINILDISRTHSAHIYALQKILRICGIYLTFISYQVIFNWYATLMEKINSLIRVTYMLNLCLNVPLLLCWVCV